jgi:N-acetylglutamate synthase-like GNAT family acetyltransferase
VKEPRALEAPCSRTAGPMNDRPDELQSRLIELIHSSPTLMRALRAARTVDPPDWLIGSGVIRDLVWSRLHGLGQPDACKDVDLVFFDPAALGREREHSVLDALRALEPDVPWDVKNQAAVHLWYPEAFGIEVEPLTSAAEGVSTWPETASAVAVRLLADERLEVVAPCGLEDLFGLVWRPNPRRVTPDEYRQRIHHKRVAERWPRARLLRNAVEQDITSVLDLWETADGPASVSDTPEGLSCLLAGDRDALLLAERGGLVVGSLIAAWDGWRGSFYKLVVHPEHRRKGFATALLHEGERHLQTRGADRLTAIVAEDDPVATGFWQTAGYERQQQARFVRHPAG